MNFNKIALITGLAVSGIAVSSVFASAKASTNLISNPSFETPTTPTGGTSSQFFAGSTIDGVWTVLGSNLNLPNTSYTEEGPATFNAEDGLNSISLSGVNSSGGPDNGIEQTISTVPNTLYNLTFWVGKISGRSYYANPSTVNLSLNGGSLIPFTNSNVTPNFVNWEQFSYSFTATTSSTTIAFLKGSTTGNNASLLDNISLTANGAVQSTPEPSFVLGLGAIAGLGLIGGLKRKLSKK